MTEPTKRCRPCGQVLPHSSFWKNRRNADGLQRYCKTCLSDMHLKSKCSPVASAIGGAALAGVLAANLFVWSIIADGPAASTAGSFERFAMAQGELGHGR